MCQTHSFTQFLNTEQRGKNKKKSFSSSLIFLYSLAVPHSLCVLLFRYSQGKEEEEESAGRKFQCMKTKKNIIMCI